MRWRSQQLTGSFLLCPQLGELLAQSPYAQSSVGLSPGEVVAAVANAAPGLSAKLWQRRSGVAAASGRFAGELLDQQARRLDLARAASKSTIADSGPDGASVEAVKTTGQASSHAATSASSAEAQQSFKAPKAARVSPRLEKARELLLQRQFD